MVNWFNPPLQKKVAYRSGDTIIAVPAKSGTTWTMNIFHQLRTGGDADFQDVRRASALCVPRRPARPVPKLTSLASGRGRGGARAATQAL